MSLVSQCEYFDLFMGGIQCDMCALEGLQPHWIKFLQRDMLFHLRAFCTAAIRISQKIHYHYKYRDINSCGSSQKENKTCPNPNLWKICRTFSMWRCSVLQINNIACIWKGQRLVSDPKLDILSVNIPAGVCKKLHIMWIHQNDAKHHCMIFRAMFHVFFSQS